MSRLQTLEQGRSSGNDDLASLDDTDTDPISLSVNTPLTQQLQYIQTSLDKHRLMKYVQNSAYSVLPPDAYGEIDLYRFRVVKDKISTLPLGHPLRQSIATSSGFGVRVDPFTKEQRHHNGLDFSAPTGTPVFATAPGLVTAVETQSGYGKLIEIDHGNGLKTRYAHLSKGLVKKYQIIKTGDEIGLVGSTGRSTGPHLHYEILADEKAVNPLPLIKLGQDFQEKIFHPQSRSMQALASVENKMKVKKK